MSDDNKHIVLLADDQNLSGLLAVINSIILNTKNLDKLMFNVIVYNNGDQVTKLFEKHFSKYSPKFQHRIVNFTDYPKYIEFLKNNIRIRGGKKYHYIGNIMNFARFYMDEIFPDIDEALYMDTDMIVQVDIMDLFNTYSPVEYLSAVHNIVLDAMGYPAQYRMTGEGFNAGIYLINLAYWRKNNYTKMMEELMKLNKTSNTKIYNLGTQPIVNLLYYKKSTKMNLKWNVKSLGHNIPRRDKMKRAFLLHWSGAHKPWLKDGLNKEYWLKYELSIDLN